MRTRPALLALAAAALVLTSGAAASGSGERTSLLVPATISSFTPPSGPLGSTVTINGNLLDTISAVSLNGVGITSWDFVNSHKIQVQVPNGATAGKFAVTSPGGTRFSSGTFHVVAGIDLFDPEATLPGAAVKLYGSGFTGASSVRFNGVSATFTVTNDGEIHATVPSSAKTGKVTVTTAAGTGTSTPTFIVIRRPTISSFTPTSVAVGEKVKIFGTNLDSVYSVTLNGVVVFDVNHFRVDRTAVANKLGFVVPSGAGNGKLVVTNAAGSGTSSGTLKVVLGVDDVSPGHGVPGDGIDIMGFGFTGASDVSVGGVGASFHVLSATKIHATVPATDRGDVAVTVHGHTSFGRFVRVVPPTIHKFTRSATIGERVYLWGNLRYTTGSLNGVDLGPFEDEGYRFSFVVPSGAHTGNIEAKNAAGTTVSDDVLKITPTVTDFTPASGPAGTTVTIHGTSFLGTSRVRLATDDAAFTVVDDSTITATVPAKRGAGKIEVVTGTGDSAAWGKSSDTFTVTAPFAPDLGY